MTEGADLDEAIAALEAQRAVLGDAVVATALRPLLERRAALQAPELGEQRKLVTVLFADLVGFTVLSRRLDAEDTRDVVGACFTRWQRVIEEHGGVVEKFIGDAVMAVFGLHRSREDDAVHAVRAATAMIASTREVADDVERRFGERLRMRVGLDTGDVVVSTLGERPGHEFVAVGPTVNRASRLQGEAPEDMVLISEDTRRQVRGRFGLDPRPGLRLKGIDEPVDAYVVLAERPRSFELERAAGVGGVEASTVGRDLELLALQEHLADVVEESSWRITTIVGDAGVGKSRLLGELDAWLQERPDPVWWFRGRASPSGQNRPHALLRDAVATRFGIAASDSPATVLERCEEGFAAAFGGSERTRRDAVVVARWLGFEVADAGEQVPRDPQGLRDEASDLLARYLEHLGRVAPVVVLLEDLHWADDASLTWLDAADPVLAHAPVLVVATARPTLLEGRPHWGEGLRHHARIALEPLSRRQSRLLLEQLLQHVQEVPRALVDLVVDGAEGNPFYIEELVTWLVDAGVVVRGDGAWDVRVDRIDQVRVPSTLKGVLQARLDSLEGPERTVLQRASVIGRVFWDDAVAQMGDAAADLPVAAALDRLRGRELVRQRGSSAFDSAREFLFKHALLRDVAYDGMLRRHRRGYHALVADWLVEVTERHGRVEEYAAVIAEHTDLADDPSAARWYLRAGARAARVYASEEALRLLGRGLRVVPEDDPVLRFDLLREREQVADRLAERDRQREDLDLMGALLDDVDVPRRLHHDLARARLAFDSSDYDLSVRWAREAAVTAGRSGLDEQAAQGHLWAGKALTWASQGDAARDELDAALAIARRAGLRGTEAETWRYLSMLAGNHGDYPRALELVTRAREMFAEVGDAEGEGAALVGTATVHYQQGRYGEARSALEQARPVFQRSGHRYREAVVLGNLGTIAAGQGELAAALRWVDEAVELTRRIDDTEALGTNLAVHAEIDAILGRTDEVRRHGTEALALARRVRLHSLAANALTMLGVAELIDGRPQEALRLVDESIEASQHAPSERERSFGLVVRGDVLLALGRPDEAVTAYEQAEQGFGRLEVRGSALEARAKRARALLAGGDATGAHEVAASLVVHLEEPETEGAQADDVAAACWEVLDAAGDPGAPDVRRAAGQRLRRRAAAVGDHDVAAEYLARPASRVLLGDRAAR